MNGSGYQMIIPITLKKKCTIAICMALSMLVVCAKAARIPETNGRPELYTFVSVATWRGNCTASCRTYLWQWCQYWSRE